MNKTPVSKREELGILDSAINQLGRDSYLGPWLTEIRGSVERDIRSDYVPMISLNEARAEAAAIVAEARVKAGEIVEAAQKQADKERAEIMRIRDQAYSQFQEVRRALERI